MENKIEKAKKLFEDGKKAYDNNNYEEAIECFRKAAELNPKDADIFYCWGRALSYVAIETQNESRLKESEECYKMIERIDTNHRLVGCINGVILANQAAFKKDDLLFNNAFEEYAKAARLYPNNYEIFSRWGTALYLLADIKNESISLLKDAADKYAIAATLPSSDEYVLYNLGSVYADLAVLEQNKSLFKKAIELYDIVANRNSNIVDTFYNWGYALAHLAKIETDENLLKTLLNDFYEVSDRLKRLKVTILEIFVLLGYKMSKMLDIKEFYHLLDQDPNIEDSEDVKFFMEITQPEEDGLLDKYKEVYIRSMRIISLLHIDFENEENVAYYTHKIVLQKILRGKSPFRLNIVAHSNDPTEGETLLRYIFAEKYPARKALNHRYGVFAGCFTFCHDTLNQFRLYGKENGIEGTGVSFVFNSDFFSKEAKLAIERSISKSNNPSNSGKGPLFRCMYIDPKVQWVETVGHKEASLFLRENKEKPSDGINKTLSRKKVRTLINSYKDKIDKITKDIRAEMEELKSIARGLKRQKIVGRLLIKLRYLVKHVAFKEEQECRVIRIHRLEHDDVQIDTESRRIYIDYRPEFSKHIKKVYFGPKATEMELFQDMLIHEGINIPCERSENPLA